MRQAGHRGCEKFIKQRGARSGFTLIELLIVLMIFSVITALFVANYRRFGNNVTLSNVADEVALSIREMQTYGLASRGTNATGSDFKKAYGIHFPVLNDRYYLFEDRADPADRKYTSGESIQQYQFPSGISVMDKCALNGTTPVSDSVLNVTFKRPDPDAMILTTGSTQYTSAAICLESNQSDLIKTVVVTQAGQIEVIDSCPC